MKDFKDRLFDLPTTMMGFVIILVAMFLVYQKIITFQDFMAFIVMALPFFYLKKQDKKEDNSEEEK